MEKALPQKLDRETLLQLPPEQLVEMIIEQAIATEELNKRILELELEVQKLKVSRDLDSQTSSKPPSGDLLKKSEKKREDNQEERETKKRKPQRTCPHVGQPGHRGKTRQGFSRVDRLEILRERVL